MLFYGDISCSLRSTSKLVQIPTYCSCYAWKFMMDCTLIQGVNGSGIHGAAHTHVFVMPKWVLCHPLNLQTLWCSQTTFWRTIFPQLHQCWPPMLPESVYILWVESPEGCSSCLCNTHRTPSCVFLPDELCKDELHISHLLAHVHAIPESFAQAFVLNVFFGPNSG